MTCRECGQEIQNGVIKAKDVIALNKKLLGRQRSQYFCEDCMAEFLDATVEDLLDKVEQFKEQGCTLFS